MSKMYKGFNKDMQCRGFQYEVGKTYEETEANLCQNGFHACENPLDVWNYYAPADSRFCEVDLDAIEEKHSNDSKRCGKKIKIGAEIGIPGLVKAFVEYTKEKVDWENAKESNDKERSAATNTGYQSAATNTGYQSAATNTGYKSAATNTGSYSAATNTGNKSAATNTGNKSAATNTGYRSAATNTGGYSAATNTGDYSAAEVTGKDSIAIATGYKSKAKAAIGSAICVVERGDWDEEKETYPILSIKAAIIDGKILKPDTFYTVINNKWVECE